MFKNHPKGLLGAALSNMGERFGYYIMNAILVLFLSAKFGLEPKTASLIYSFFYAGIYGLSLIGGLIADRSKKYKGTIMSGLIVMATGYVLLAIPTPTPVSNLPAMLAFTCFSLFLVAFGNGLFKGNLQAIVGQMYDNPHYKEQRDAGFQIFYMFINIGGFFAPFIAPYLRSWWLHKNLFEYNAALPELCHRFLNNHIDPQQLDNLNQYATAAVMHGNATDPANLNQFCAEYLNVFNTGFHYAFIASIIAMAISLIIFLCSKQRFPNPSQKLKAETATATTEERTAMAKELRQRILAVFAVLGVVIFFWFSFHQNGVSLSFFARDFVNTQTIAPEIWQAVNPFFVVVLTPVIMFLLGALKKRGREPSTPMKIAIGMGIAGLAYAFLTIVSAVQGFPSYNEYATLNVAAQEALKTTPWVMIGMYFLLTVAELFISPLGISFISKVAPQSMQGMMQALWLTATAVGNILLFVGGMLYEAVPLWMCWMVFAAACALSMTVMLAMLHWLEKIAR